MIGQFSDENFALFLLHRVAGQQDVIVRKKEIYDGAVPSGNAVNGSIISGTFLSFLITERMGGQGAGQ